MASGRLIDYLGADLIANRDPTPDLHPNTLGIFYATDTDALSIWDGTAWSDVVGSGTVNTVVAGTGIDVDSTDPANPEVALDSASIASLALADSAVQSIVQGTGVTVDNTDPQNPIISATGGGSGDVVGPASSVDDRIATFDGTTGKLLQDGGYTIPQVRLQSIIVACSDETTDLTTGTSKVRFRMPYAFTLTAVRASLSTAQASGSTFTVDINENGTTILSTKLTIDNTEKTSTTATTPPIISDSSLADDAEITIDIDQVGTAGAKGLKVALIGYPT